MSDNVPISKRLVLINAASSVLSRVLGIGGLVYVQQYLIRRLTPEEYALYPPILAIVLFAPVLMSLVTGGVLRFVTEAYAKGDERRVTEIVSSIMPLICVFILGLLAIGGWAAFHVDVLLNVYPKQLQDAQLMMFCLVLSQAVTLFLVPVSIGLHVRQKFVWLNIIELGEEVLRLGVMFALLFGIETRVLWVVVATLIARVVAAVITAMASRAALPALRVRRSAYRRETARMLTGFGAWTMLGNLVAKITMNVDSIILNRLGTAVDVTAYHVASLPDRQVMRFISLVSTSLQAPLTAMHATNREESLQRAYLRGNRFALWFSMAIATPLMVFADELIDLYIGNTYAIAAIAVVLIYGMYPLCYATEMLYSVAMATGRVKKFMLLITGGGIAKLVLTLVLVGPGQLGAVGAALASWIAVFGLLLFFWPLGLRLLKISFRSFLSDTLIPGYLPAIVMAGTCWGLKSIVPADSWFVVTAEVALGLVVYVLVALLSFRAEDRRDLREVFDRFVGVVRRRG